ncbi:MAG: hypothetical protein SFX18_14460 [Pirellulales bacterium]|nr:hypothetical protein [Pirellulales bacterium]
MDARNLRARGVLAIIVLACNLGAGFQTPNFTVQAPTPELAERIGRAAEKYRHVLAILWTGQPMPDWSAPCPIVARVAPTLGAGGETSFLFDRGEVYGWQMKIQGSEERVLDSVLPHEITHTIFASHFRRPLPRWADEGACTTMEHISERGKQHRLLYEFLKTDRGIAFSELFVMKQYPPEMLPLYAEGYSLAKFLLQQGGRLKFVAFLQDGMRQEQWSAAVKKHYGYENLGDLQNSWLAWVKQGMPALNETAAELEGPPTMEMAQAFLRGNGRIIPVGRTAARGQKQSSRDNLTAVASSEKPEPATGYLDESDRQIRQAQARASQAVRESTVNPATAVPRDTAALAEQDAADWQGPIVDQGLPAGIGGGLSANAAGANSLAGPPRSIYERKFLPSVDEDTPISPSAPNPTRLAPLQDAAGIPAGQAVIDTMVNGSAPGAGLASPPSSQKVLLEWGRPAAANDVAW